MTNNECYACGEKWEDHKGVVWTCDELHKLRDLAHQMCFALLSPGLTTTQKMIQAAFLLGDIRALNPEKFDKEVSEPCGLSF